MIICNHLYQLDYDCCNVIDDDADKVLAINTLWRQSVEAPFEPQTSSTTELIICPYNMYIYIYLCLCRSNWSAMKGHMDSHVFPRIHFIFIFGFNINQWHLLLPRSRSSFFRALQHWRSVWCVRLFINEILLWYLKISGFY